LDAGSHTPAVPQRALTCFFRCFIGLPHKELGRLPANSPLETTSCGRRFRGGRYFFTFRPPILCCPRSSLPLRILPQGSRGFYVRAERASLPPHAPDMLTVRIQATDGTRTFTSLDPRPCRLLPPLMREKGRKALYSLHRILSMAVFFSRVDPIWPQPAHIGVRPPTGYPSQG
jgi:hypothetical protein